MSLQFGDEILDDTKMLSDYNLTYHCKVMLLYCNPYITLTVHYLADTSDIDIDSTLPAKSILSCYAEVGHYYSD